MKQYMVLVKLATNPDAFEARAAGSSRAEVIEAARDLPDGTYYLVSVLRPIEVRPSTRVVQKVVELGSTLQPRSRKH